MSDRFDEVIAELRSDRQEMRREFASWSAHIDRLQEQTDENIRFLRELNRRGEIALQQLVRSQTAMREEIRASIETIKGQTETINGNTETIKGNSESIKAHTRAIYALVDRLEGGGGLAPAT